MADAQLRRAETMQKILGTLPIALAAPAAKVFTLQNTNLQILQMLGRLNDQLANFGFRIDVLEKQNQK